MKNHLRFISILVLHGSGSDAQEYPRQYHLWSSELIHETLKLWKTDFPDLIRVSTSQEAFGLQSAGQSSDCPFDGDSVGCLNYFATIQDFMVHPQGSDSSRRLPAVLLSGCLHGNERVGPTVVMETASLMLRAASCEALPRMQEEIDAALACREALREQGITDMQRKWLARLVATRRLVIVPTPNALGYYRDIRTEGYVDPNRDFAFDTDPFSCMQTIAARTLNELFRDDMFQMCFTFHGGIELIGFEWGATSYRSNTISPDDIAQARLAEAFSWYGGSWSTTSPYRTGRINDILYHVHGGMEDWAYAGSWDKDLVPQCKPTTFGGYPDEKTLYNNSTLRAFNMLVEISDDKEPLQSTLGDTEDVLNESTPGNGHVSRNVRLSVAAIDLVEPYLSIAGVDNFMLADDIVPLSPRSCETLSVVSIPPGIAQVTIHWNVGGAMEIDETRLWTADAKDVSHYLLQGCKLQPDLSYIQRVFQSGDAQAGSAFFDSGRASQIDPASSFSSTVDVSLLSGKDEMMVLVSAIVDSSWALQPQNTFSPLIPPQSHLANVRTNPGWYHESANKVVQGRLDWFSLPIKLTRGTSSEIEEKNNRFEISMQTLAPAAAAPSPAPSPLRSIKPSLKNRMSMAKLQPWRGGVGGGARRNGRPLGRFRHQRK